MFIKRIEKFLANNRVYIVPTKNGFIFLATTFVSTLLGVIYSNNTALLISFILFSLFMLHMFVTNFNLAGLTITKAIIADGYIKDNLKLTLNLANKTQAKFQSLNIDIDFENAPSKSIQIEDFPDDSEVRVELPFSLQSRGRYEVKRVTLWTRFPMGLFYAWSPLKTKFSFFVYPNPKGTKLNEQLVSYSDSEKNESIRKKQTGDFYQHRRHQDSDSLSKIDWKVFAKTKKLYIKEYSTGDIKFFELSVPESEDLEKSLEQVSLWIRDLNETPHQWSLKVKNNSLELGSGREHFINSMRELAVYE